jgi:hypothetical protein
MGGKRGRVSFLDDQLVGHVGPGAQSSTRKVAAALRPIGRSLMANVGIVIVSHSAKVAASAADIVRQIAGRDVSPARMEADPAGGFGAITEVIHRAYAWLTAYDNAIGGYETADEYFRARASGPLRHPRSSDQTRHRERQFGSLG